MTTATTSPQVSDSFEQTVADQTAAAASISETIEKQNTVVLGFCTALIKQTLDAMGQLSELVKSTGQPTTNTGTADEIMRKVLDTIQQQPAQATDITPPGTGVDSQITEAVYIQAMNQTIKNTITAQQQLYVIAQAATVQTIAAIISISTDAIGKSAQ